MIYILRHISLGTRPIYRGDLGQYAWILHRVAGAGIVFFLLIHIIDIMLIGFGREVYDEAVSVYSAAFLVPMEIALVGAVFYHTLNGLRIILINFSQTRSAHAEAALLGRARHHGRPHRDQRLDHRFTRAAVTLVVPPPVIPTRVEGPLVARNPIPMCRHRSLGTDSATCHRTEFDNQPHPRPISKLDIYHPST